MSETCLDAYYRVKALIDAPLQMQSLLGKVGRFVDRWFVDYRYGDLPFVLQFREPRFGMVRVAFRESEVEPFYPEKPYPF